MRRSKLIALVVSLVLVLAIAGGAIWYFTGASKNDKITLTVFNCYDYIDEAVLEQFTQETGIEVKYVCYTTNEEMYTKLQSNPSAYDVIFPSDYMIERLIAEGGLAQLDLSAIPNAAGVRANLLNPAYDPAGAYSVPYMWGTMGILYNTTMVDEPIETWAQLFDPKYQDQVIMMNSVRDTMGAALRYNGYSMNSTNPDELAIARDTLIAQNANGIVRAYQLDETKDMLSSGNAAIGVVYSGDALYAMDLNADLAYSVPLEGSNIWVDGMCIPAGSRNQEAAMLFINFLCREDIARANMDYIHYSTPIQAVVDNMTEEERSNTTLVPTEEIMARCEFFVDVGEALDLYEDAWTQVRMSN